MPNNVIPIPRSAGNADAEDQRQRALFAWADLVLYGLGLIERIARAESLDELRKLTFDPYATEVTLAIRAALHPASGTKADYFSGLREGSLQRILKNRFRDMKADRDAELRGHGEAGRQQPVSDWTDGLKLDAEGGIRQILSNLTLILSHQPKWKGVLAYDEFNARVVIRSRPPWGEEKPDAHWEDKHETQARIWFQRKDIDAGLGDVGRAVQAAARHNTVHPVREYLDGLVWDRKPRLDTGHFNGGVFACHVT